jgi:hypothetical protein
MTPEEIREKLAEFMGWELVRYSQNPSPFYAYWVNPDDESSVHYGNWQPDQDRNQLALVLDKVADMGLQRAVTKYFIDRHMEKLTSGSVYNGHGALWDALTTPPETICKAIISVIKKDTP